MANSEEILLPSAQQSFRSPILIKTYSNIYFNTQNVEHAVEFFKELKILFKIYICSKYQSPMRKTKNKSCGDKCKWTCTSKTACGYATTIRTGTWLTKSKLSLTQITKIMFCWSYKLLQQFAASEANVSTILIVDWYNFCYDIYCVTLMNQNKKVRDEEKIVKIDKSKFSKCKYNKVSVPNRSKEMLLKILEENVKKETIIYSDC
ncbi:15781_t:CDS:2 [Cetraspora pellucida]|uniref:15781_t:CDS:1 n=1 Tax=Cetraspora pellucida TaxID=1433469 RepID=A0ACA9PB48_9GLOM|nr:15781_t:CDS:2 [Cetraspora pellucida]